MEKKLVYHHNLIGHEINESLRYFRDDVFDREIYCRKKHQVCEPSEADCLNCTFFAGLEQGHGHECAWEDVTEEEHVIEHADRYKEYERVDRLMKLGVLENADDSLIAKVKSVSYDEKKWIYEQSEDRMSRFILGTRGERTLICCGVNPSFASPEDLDPTMKNVESFAKANGYDSYLMINLYPMRATNPKDMHKVKDDAIIRKNIDNIKKALSSGNCDIWAAWGTLIKTRSYLKDCLQQIVEVADTYNCEWYTIGKKSKDGHPHHPLYLSKQSKMEKFDVQEYLKSLN